jgi:hypothetical protein
MSTVFFKISDQQAKEVQTFMDAEGYSSKAEFFRFLIKFFKYQKSPAQLRFEKAEQELADMLIALDKRGKLKTLSLDKPFSGL